MVHISENSPHKRNIRASLIFVCSGLPVLYGFFIHTESSWQSRPVLLDFMQLGLWFLEHFSDGKDSLYSPGSPSLDIGAHPTSLHALCQSQQFMQLCGKMFQEADLGGEKRNPKHFFFPSQSLLWSGTSGSHMNTSVGIAWGGQEQRKKAALWKVLFKQCCSLMCSHSESPLLCPWEGAFMGTIQVFISNSLSTLFKLSLLPMAVWGKTGSWSCARMKINPCKAK